MTKGRIGVPEAMALEHAELHEAMVRATRAPEPVGEAARVVAAVLHQHLMREEEIALPPLGLLLDLAEGAITPDMAQVLPLTDALEAELPGMLREHDEIRGVVENLRDVARAHGRAEEEQLAEKLLLHLRTEEQVTYPAAILVGRTVKAALGR